MSQARRLPAEQVIPSALRSVLFTGPEALIQQMVRLDYLVNCEAFEVGNELAVSHSGLHPQIRERTRSQKLYSEKAQEIRNFLSQYPVPTNGMTAEVYRFGIFCQSGMHRSVSFAEELAGDLRHFGWTVAVVHLNDHSWPCKRGHCEACQEVFGRHSPS